MSVPLHDYPIPPEDCLVARAFDRSRSLRDAARLLRCDPATLVRKAQRIESQQRLLHKIRGRWTLTERGRRAVQWVEQSLAEQALILEAKPRFRISATAWLAEQILLPAFGKLDAATERRYAWTLQTATGRFEPDLLDGVSDYVIACHAPQDPAISHRRAGTENWLAIVPPAWSASLKRLSERELRMTLAKRPFIRHATINPAESLGEAFDLTESELRVDTLTSVRAAVAGGLGWSCAPELAVRSLIRARALATLPLKLEYTGTLCVWWLRSRKDCAREVSAMAQWLAAASR